MKKILGILIITIILLVTETNTSLASSLAYTVQKGDTLYKIANMHNISITNLKSWNNLKSDLIYPNQKLTITTTGIQNPSRTNSEDKVIKEFVVSASAFTANCNGCTGITSTGINLKRNPTVKVIAVDPNVIKLGTKVHVEGYGYAIAGDTGGGIKGNKIDVFFSSTSAAYKWGRKNVTIKILE